MAFFRIYPSKDTSIANYDAPLEFPLDIRYSNVGASEILNLYQTTWGGRMTGSAAHILMQFDLAQVPAAALAAGAEYHLKMFDAQHGETIPSEFGVVIAQVSRSWVEGVGHDMDYYTDIAASNWVEATSLVTWSQEGGDSRSTIDPDLPEPMPVPFWNILTATCYFQSGHEDLEADVSLMTEDWLVNGNNFGAYIQIDPALSGSDLYIKKFHSRHSHFPMKRPFLEVRWPDATATLSTTASFVASSGPWSGHEVDSRLSGTISGTVTSRYVADVDPTGALVVAIPQLRTVYDRMETPVLRVKVLRKDWNPATIPQTTWETANVALTDAYYRIVADESEEVLVPFATGSVPYTKMSCDDFGNSFKVYMASLPIDTVLRFDIGYNISGSWTMHRGDGFKFRVI